MTMDPRPDQTAEPWVLDILEMADIAPLAQGRSIVCVPGLETSFVVDPASNELRMRPREDLFDPNPRLLLRHALEVCLQLELCPQDPVLAGLMAARTGALFAALECTLDEVRELAPWNIAFASDVWPTADEIDELWPTLAEHQLGAPKRVQPETVSRLRELWPLLGPAEHLMGTGGDVRLKLDAETGLNAYGCSSRPRPWAVTFASSTASSISERGYAAAESARRRMLGDALEHGIEHSQQSATESVRRELAKYYRLPPGARIILTPSGTDGELCALAVAHLAESCVPLTSLLVAPEETGRGVPLAATGRHFDTLTARGVTVSPGTVIDGFPDDIELATVSARADDGRIRPSAEVDADCASTITASVARGRRILLHVMDQSKTGLVVPGAIESIAAGRAELDVLVDACQARLSVATIGDYLQRGFMVLVTGSKFFTGPPFSGALLLPSVMAHRLDTTKAVPGGLAQYFGRFDWPQAAGACAPLNQDGNVGLALRWEAALAEMKAFSALGPARIKETLIYFGSRIRAAIVANPDLYLHQTPAPPRPQHPDRWDAIATIFTFAIWVKGPVSVAGRFMDLEEAREVYFWLNADISRCLPGGLPLAEQVLAVRQFHIGQPVELFTQTGRSAGALRISAGARLVSGEPSQAQLQPADRLRKEVDDALAALDKVSLILRHIDGIRAADPRPCYRSYVPAE